MWLTLQLSPPPTPLVDSGLKHRLQAFFLPAIFARQNILPKN